VFLKAYGKVAELSLFGSLLALVAVLCWSPLWSLSTLSVCAPIKEFPLPEFTRSLFAFLSSLLVWWMASKQIGGKEKHCATCHCKDGAA